MINAFTVLVCHLLIAAALVSPSTSPESFSAVPAAMTVQFSWSPPSHINSTTTTIANYTLTCSSRVDGVSNLTVTYAEAGSYTPAGFRPTTVYNCYVYASNMAGDGPPSNISFTTMDDS